MVGMVNAAFARVGLVALGLLVVPGVVVAQSSGSMFSPGGIRFGEGPSTRPKPKSTAPQGPTLKPDPRQRLDAGALFCRTESDLQQHEVAVTARLDGREAPEPVGCRPVRFMTAVAVLDRHGPARTQVRIPGPPEQIGWTDAVVHD
jgi:hypothetical protein